MAVDLKVYPPLGYSYVKGYILQQLLILLHFDSLFESASVVNYNTRSQKFKTNVLFFIPWCKMCTLSKLLLSFYAETKMQISY